MNSITATPNTLAFTWKPELLRTKTGQAILICAFALLTAAASQISIPLSFTPVPITAQTFAVLSAGAFLGSWRGAASQALYALVGATGLRIFSEHSGGWHVLKGATGGYIVGFIVASYVVGLLAEKKRDRNFLGTFGAFLIGSVIIYTFGALWLAHVLNIPILSAVDSETSSLPASAISLGVAPFIIGDLIKALLAALAFPTVWKFAPKENEQTK